MAAKTVITLEDDLDGTAANETLRFGLGTAEYEIDLSAANADRFRAQLAPFVDHARKVTHNPRARTGRAGGSRRDSAQIRSWAREHGVEISERGRIPASVIDQYDAVASAR
ncbi:MAG TPA: Lsr2 family protein [Streptosporangiaceae bacterium]|nr:Lsr2 family protein [Streptosporangiaceae bacterium]